MAGGAWGPSVSGESSIVPVAVQDSASNAYIQDVVGNKTDSGSLIKDVASLLALTRKAAKEAWEVEHHVHTRERWAGLAALPSGETHRADLDVMAPFRIDAGNDTWGAWVQICGSEDSPFIAVTNTHIDVHRLVILDVEHDVTLTRIQLAGGDSGAAGLAAGDYTELLFIPLRTNRQEPVNLKMERFPVGTKGWARCWVAGENTGTVDFFYGIHEYQDPDV